MIPDGFAIGPAAILARAETLFLRLGLDPDDQEMALALVRSALDEFKPRAIFFEEIEAGLRIVAGGVRRGNRRDSEIGLDFLRSALRFAEEREAR